MAYDIKKRFDKDKPSDFNKNSENMEQLLPDEFKLLYDRAQVFLNREVKTNA